MNILITGAAGFIGRHLVSYLQEKYPEANLIGITRDKGPGGHAGPPLHGVSLTQGERRNQIESVYLIYGELSDFSFCEDILNQYQPDLIFHLAGSAFSPDFNSLLKDNVSSFHAIASGVLKLKLNSRVVIIGSAMEYGLVSQDELPVKENYLGVPRSDYGYAKACQTDLAIYFASKGLNVSVARIFSVIGSGASEKLLLGVLFSQLKAGSEKLILKGTDIGRDFLDIADICSGLDVIAKKGLKGEIYNLCSGDLVFIDELAKLLLTHFPEVDLEIQPPIESAEKVAVIVGDNQKLKNLGWQSSVSLKQSIEKTLELEKIQSDLYCQSAESS